MLTILRILEEHKGKVLFAGGIILGLIIGLIFAWLIAPVKFINATPGHLRTDFQLYYFNSVAEDYSQDRNLDLARLRLGLVRPGEDGQLEPEKSNPWVSDPRELKAFLEEAVLPEAILSDNQAMDRLAQDLAVAEGVELEIPTVTEEPPEVEEPQPEEGRSRIRSILTVLGLLLLVLALVGGGFYLLTRFRQPQKAERDTGRASAYGVVAPTEEEEVVEGEVSPPLSSFMATYVLGDDFFDPSFSIEVGNDFLGECGIGISESIGVGDPKKVTALEAWLFDKSDIRTVTTVLASEYAFNDPSLKAKLAAKGDVVRIEPGMEIKLETTALRVRVRVKEVEYAEGDLPDNSFFQKVAVELRAWVKSEETAPAA
ncbi:MAG: hypothetical protein ACP5GX_01000 [Anaerolineae bacterium]